MTIEDITQTLQTVASNQAQTSADISALREQTEKLAGVGSLLEEAAALHQQVLRNYEARQAKLEESFRQVAESHAQLVEMLRLHEERLDGHDDVDRGVDEKLKALIDAQVGLEARQARFDESYQLLVQLARIQEERIDGQDEARVHTDARLDALIDSQIALGQRFEQMTTRIDQIGEHLDQATEAIKALVAAQTRTDEQIRQLVDRNGSTAKPKPKAKVKKAKKASKKGSAK